MTKILVLDIGGVIVFHDNDMLLQRLRARMEFPPDEGTLLALIRSSGIGTGASSVFRLWSTLTTNFSLSGDYDDFLSDWSCHFSPNTQMLESINSIAATHTIILCSNTNREHWLALCERYQLGGICQHAVLSFEVGIEKPDTSIYVHVANLYPEVTKNSFLFLDDKAENVASAIEYGFCGHLYLDHSSFLNELKCWSLI